MRLFSYTFGQTYFTCGMLFISIYTPSKQSCPGLSN